MSIQFIPVIRYKVAFTSLSFPNLYKAGRCCSDFLDEITGLGEPIVAPQDSYLEKAALELGTQRGSQSRSISFLQKKKLSILPETPGSPDIQPHTDLLS